ALSAALFLAALSKMQHPGVPIAIFFGIAIIRWKAVRAGRVASGALTVPAVAAVVALVVGVVNNESRSLSSMAQAAATDTWFATVLPALRDPRSLLAAHGVPERCSAYVGKTWYDPGMQPGPCPEIFGLSRFTAVWALLREPSAL